MDLATAAVAVFAVGCVFFTFVGVVGVVRLPDVYTRAHAVSKADTLGAGFAVLAVAVSFGWSVAALQAVLLVVIIFVTNPTAIHALVRSAYSNDVEMWDQGGPDGTEGNQGSTNGPGGNQGSTDGTGGNRGGPVGTEEHQGRPERTTAGRKNPDKARGEYP